MTCIAFRDGILAADCQSNTGPIRVRHTKLQRAPNGDLMATMGDTGHGMMLRQWYAAGALIDDFPAWEGEDDEGAALIVLTRHGLFEFDRYPIGIHVEDEFAAFGSGREVALGAMHMGATAREAVEAAIRFVSSCGMGVEASTWGNP